MINEGPISEKLVALRHEFHQKAELGLHLPSTQAVILRELAKLELEVTTGSSLSSVTAVLRGRAGTGNHKARKVILLRSDMDALSVTEPDGPEPRSLTSGVMHACGHDVHMAALIGAAIALHSRKDTLAGDIVFMFQPGEESDHGAKLMIEEGVLEAAGQPVTAAYALHVLASQIPLGVFASRPGPMMAGADGIKIRVIGAGGHGATPHLGKDPIPVAAEMVLALQTMVTRQFDIFEPALVSVGQFHAGSHRSVIPDDSVIDVSVRTFTPGAREKAIAAVQRLCTGVAAAHGLEVSFFITAGYPALVNSETDEAFAASVAREVFGDDHYQRIANPFPLSEDFSEILQRVPGAFITLGACPTHLEPREAPSNHSPLALYDDRVIVQAAKMLTELATHRVNQPLDSAR